MSRQSRTHRHLRRLCIADLAEHDLVDVRAQHGTETCGIRHARLLVHLDLIDAFDAIFRRILDRHDIVLGRIDFRKRRIERRRLARIHRPRDQDHAAGLMTEATEKRLVPRGKAQILNSEKLPCAGKEAQHRLLSRQKRQGRQTEVDGLAALGRAVRDAPILRHAMLHALQMRHDLQTGKQKRMHLLWDRCMRFQQTSINTVTDADGSPVRLDVDVACPQAQSLRDHVIDELHDGHAPRLSLARQRMSASCADALH